MSLIYRLTQLRKRYGSRQVLDIESLEIHPGEIVSLVGPSGAGKSTLLRMMNFLEPPDGGTLEYNGVNAAEKVTLEMRRQVTTVFQRPVLFDMSVKDNVAYGLRLRSERNASSQIRAILEKVHLVDLANQPARTLSGGEAQRVALARALVIRPKVLLLDEPTANLDPGNVALIEEIIQQVNREHGTTCVLVTHNVFQAHRLAHRVGLLLEGRLVELAQVADFFERPADPRTAAFVRGDMIY